MAKPKKKKLSIREFVSEESLKFQLYYLKLANQLKQIDDKTPEEIIKKWEYNTNKKIDRFKNDMKKPQFSSDIAQDAIQKNIEYVKNLPAPVDKDKIYNSFEKIRTDYIVSLEKRIEENSTATLNQDKELLEYAKKVQLQSIVSKEKFGLMLLLMIKNLATMPSFSGYSDNWKTDFFSNAIEKTLLYLDNFDEQLVSKRSGEKSKAFAYVTQICFNAFVNIINIRKKEDSFLKDTISLESTNLDGLKYYNTAHETKDDETPKDEHIVKIKKLKELDDAIIKGISFIKSNNEILTTNQANQSEIEYLNKTVPLQEKDNDYDDYIADLQSKIVPQLIDNKIEVLRIIKPKDTPLGDWTFPEDDVLCGISLIVSEKAKKVKAPEVPKLEVIEIDEVKEFDEEW